MDASGAEGAVALAAQVVDAGPWPWRSLRIGVHGVGWFSNSAHAEHVEEGLACAGAGIDRLLGAKRSPLGFTTQTSVPCRTRSYLYLLAAHAGAWAQDQDTDGD